MRGIASWNTKGGLFQRETVGTTTAVERGGLSLYKKLRVGFEPQQWGVGGGGSGREPDAQWQLTFNMMIGGEKMDKNQCAKETAHWFEGYLREEGSIQCTLWYFTHPVAMGLLVYKTAASLFWGSIVLNIKTLTQMMGVTYRDHTPQDKTGCAFRPCSDELNV
jgi:hypothetical protein